MDTKEKILQASLELFLKNGVREMSIQKLVIPLGISTKTIYKYFKNKEVLLEEVFRLHYNQQYQWLKELSETQNSVTLFYDIWNLAVNRELGVNNKFFSDMHYYYPEMEHKIEREVATRFWDKLQDIITNGINEGFFRENIHPAVFLEGISILAYRIGRSEQFQKFRITNEEIFQNTISIYIKGICTQKGLAELENHISNNNSQLNYIK